MGVDGGGATCVSIRECALIGSSGGGVGVVTLEVHNRVHKSARQNKRLSIERTMQLLFFSFLGKGEQLKPEVCVMGLL